MGLQLIVKADRKKIEKADVALQAFKMFIQRQLSYRRKPSINHFHIIAAFRADLTAKAMVDSFSNCL